MRWFLNLRKGLDLIDQPYHVNDYRAIKRAVGSVACVIGKPHVIPKIPKGIPIVYGPGVSAHPYEDDFWGERDIRLILLSCSWLKEMYDSDLPIAHNTAVWPAGVDTERWVPSAMKTKGRVLLYDKIRWDRDDYVSSVLDPIEDYLVKLGFVVVKLRYGEYEEDEYLDLVKDVEFMVFLCEHETQGFAYLQALSCNVPIIAWDRGGFWRDPSMYPHRVRFESVCSVPYFGEECGERFSLQCCH
jgi:glycosyltransferase involved in cell wall biosynthesis